MYKHPALQMLVSYVFSATLCGTVFETVSLPVFFKAQRDYMFEIHLPAPWWCMMNYFYLAA